MKINKNSLDKLIIEVMTQVSANPFTDSVNPEKSLNSSLKTTSSLTQDKTQTSNPNKIEIDKSILKSIFSTKEKIRNNIQRLPAKELVDQVSVLLDQLNFLDDVGGIK